MSADKGFCRCRATQGILCWPWWFWSVNRELQFPSQPKPFCEQHVSYDKNYILSKNTFFLMTLFSHSGWGFILYLFSMLEVRTVLMHQLVLLIFSRLFPASQKYEYKKRIHSLEFLWSLLVISHWGKIYHKLTEPWMSCWNSSHVFRFAGGWLMKQPCVLSPGAVQQNPTGQHSENMLKPSLLCKANWICFSGENSTNMDNIKF